MGLRAAGFWVSAAGVAWVLVGYPGSLLLLRPRAWRTDSDSSPSVTVIVPAYFEMEALPPKLRSVQALDYPPDRVQIVVAVDGNEQLAEMVRTKFPGVDLALVPQRSGKPTALNAALEMATGEILLLSDAHNPFDADSLRSAVRHFGDDSISAVTGRWAELGSVYDRYEDAIRRLESRSGSVAGMFGAFIAVRRDRMPSLPLDVVNEDLWLLCRLVREGGRVVYEPAASSREPGLQARMEVERRTRIAAGRVMLLSEMRGLPPAFLWRLASHKLGRLSLPFMLASAFGSSLSLVSRRRYRVAALLQATVYGVGALSATGHRPRAVPSWAAQPLAQFTVGNYATAAGVIRGLRRRQSVTWKTVR